MGSRPRPGPGPDRYAYFWAQGPENMHTDLVRGQAGAGSLLAIPGAFLARNNGPNSEPAGSDPESNGPSAGPGLIPKGSGLLPGWL